MKRFSVVLLVALLVAAAFGSYSPRPANAGAPGPVRSRTLVIGMTDEPPMLDSVRTTSNAAFAVLQQSMEGLVRPGRNGAPEPGAAASWVVSDDGLTYTFTLREGLKWSDGQPVTAADFAYAWMRALDPATGPDYAYLLYPIKGASSLNLLDPASQTFLARRAEALARVGISTPDTRTLKVTLESPLASLPNLLTHPVFLPPRQDLVEKQGGEYGADPTKMAFNGPFTVSFWIKGDTLGLDKNPQYWDRAGVSLEHVYFRFPGSGDDVVKLYDAGLLDMVQLPYGTVEPYRQRPDFRQEAQETVRYLVFNTKFKPYLGNVKIRKAISLALDRTELADKVYQGDALPATGFVPTGIHVGTEQYTAPGGTWLAPTADLTGARELFQQGLTELGLKELPPITLQVNLSGRQERYVAAIEAMLERNLPGLTINVKRFPWAEHQDRLQSGDFDLAYAGWIADWDDPGNFLELFTTGNGWGHSRWSNAQYDQLVRNADRTLDQAARLSAYREAESLLMAEMPVVPVVFVTNAYLRAPYVQHVTPLPLTPWFDLKYATVE